MIDGVLTKSGAELIKIQIGLILLNEITEQRRLATGSIVPETVEYKSFLDTFFDSGNALNLFVDRFNPLDQTEYNGIVLNLTKETIGDYSAKSERCTANYTIDVICASGDSSSVNGDVIATQIAQRISGAIKKIFNHTLYCRLGLTAGIISSKKIEDRNFYIPNTNDVENITGCSLNLKVEFDEFAISNSVILLSRNSTTFESNGRFSLQTEISEETPS